MSCVRPGVLLTKASRVWLTNVLIALDLPALERPANAISAPAEAGNNPGLATEVTKTAFLNRDMDETTGFGGVDGQLRVVRCGVLTVEYQV